MTRAGSPSIEPWAPAAARTLLAVLRSTTRRPSGALSKRLGGSTFRPETVLAKVITPFGVGAWTTTFTPSRKGTRAFAEIGAETQSPVPDPARMRQW